jgi:hypothetical protein
VFESSWIDHISGVLVVFSWSADVVIKRVMELISQRTQGNFAALLTADAAKTVVQMVCCHFE